MNVKNLKEKKQTLINKMEALVQASEELTTEQQNEFDSLKAEVEKVSASIEKAEALEALKANADNQANRPVPMDRIVKEDVKGDSLSFTKIELPKNVSKVNNLKCFSTSENAYSFGMWTRACLGDYASLKWCEDRGIAVDKFATSHNSTTDAQGGFLVPTAYSADIHSLMYQYGVARKEANVINLTTDTFNRPKRLTGLTAYFTAESVAGTESNKTFGQIQLNVKDLTVLTRMTKQLSQDSLINIADDLAREIAYQMAYMEDYCLFKGDGTSTYGSITGLSKRLTDTYGDSDGKGLVVSSATDLDDVTLVELRKVIAKTPSFARLGAKWYVSPVVFDNVFAMLAEKAGGNQVTNIINGVPVNYFMGYPVVLSEVIDSTPANNTVIAYFGNLKQTVDFGDRQQIAVDFSDSAVIGGESVFERNQIAVRGTERFAMNVHSYGQNTEPTPVVGLMIDTNPSA